MRILGEHDMDWAKGQVDWPIVDVEVCEMFLEVKYGGFILHNLSGNSRPSAALNSDEQGMDSPPHQQVQPTGRC
jgi:hypothetical protein